jgi:hypothetical protein
VTPQPGRLVSLGAEHDREDAQAIIGVVEAWGPRPRRLVRSALTAGWEYPRYPRPLVLRGVKLPAPWPWSSEARREAQRAANEGRPTRPHGLVHEHVQPIGAVVAAVVENPALRNADALSAFLFERLTYAVISVAEDQLLTEADRAGIVYDGDLWARYRAAGLDVETFAPLDDSRPRQESRRTAQVPGERACGEPDCDRPYYSAGLCRLHYGRIRRSSRERTCMVEGCSGAFESRGVCATHYAEAQNRGLWQPGRGPLPRHILAALS